MHAAPSLRDEKKDEQSTETLDVEKLAAELAACKEDSALLEKKLVEIDDKYKRALAEMENVRKRARADIENQKMFAIQKFSKSLIQVADIFTLAAESVKEDEVHKSGAAVQQMYKGLLMTKDELHKAFQEHGLQKFEPLGEPFDPNAHEAVFEMPDPTRDAGTIGSVQQAGYMLNNRTLRAAKVGVVRKQE
eukprot:CFRG5051T1